MKQKKPKVALVLGGGGIKPFVTLPLFDFLKKNHIDIHLMVGSSGGALVGALNNIGLDSQQIRDDVIRLTKQPWYLSWNLSFFKELLPWKKREPEISQGFISPFRVCKMLKTVIGDLTFDDLDCRFIVHATELKTGKGTQISTGSLIDALYASMCIYPFMQPCSIAGKYYVDGAFSSPIPVEYVLMEEVDLLIILTFGFDPDYTPESFFKLTNNFYCLTIENKGLERLKEGLKHFKGKVIHIDYTWEKAPTTLDTAKLEAIIDSGDAYVERYKDEILKTYNALSEEI